MPTVKALIVNAPPVAVMVLKLPVVAKTLPPDIVPTSAGDVSVGVLRAREFLSCPVPVCDTDITASSVEKLLAMCEVTLTVSEVVARIRLKFGDVVLIISLPKKMNVVS